MYVILASDLLQLFDCGESLVLVSGGEIDFGIVFEECLVKLNWMTIMSYLARFPANSSVSTSDDDNFAREVRHVSGCPMRFAGEYFLDIGPEAHFVDDFVLFAFEWTKACGMFAGLKRSRVGLIYCL